MSRLQASWSRIGAFSRRFRTAPPTRYEWLPCFTVAVVAGPQHGLPRPCRWSARPTADQSVALPDVYGRTPTRVLTLSAASVLHTLAHSAQGTRDVATRRGSSRRECRSGTSVMSFGTAERREVAHARSDRSPNWGTSFCQADNGIALSRRRWSRQRPVAPGPTGRRSWDLDIGIGRAAIVQSRQCISVQRLVFTPIKTHRSAHSITLDASVLR